MRKIFSIVLALGMLTVTILGSLGVVKAGETIPKLPIGMNIPSNNYYTTCLFFTDAMKTASEMITYDIFSASPKWDTGLISSIPRDENGYPLELPYKVNGVDQAITFLINSHYQGEYVMLYDGIGEFAINNCKYTVKNGRIYLSIDGMGEHLWINIKKSQKGNHIRNIRIIPSRYEGQEAKMPAFRSDFLDGLKPFHVLRFMDFTNTNNSTQKLWSEHIPKTYYSQGTDRGISFEYAIELCNLLNMDGWFSVPHQACDDYIIKLAQLMKSQLNPHLKAYIEYSNEIWNWGFDQSHYVGRNAPDAADQYVIDDLKAIHPTDYQHPEKDAYMIGRTFRLFKSVFSESARQRIVLVAGVQTSWVDNTRRILEYLTKVIKEKPDAVAGTAYMSYETSQWDSIPKTVIPWNVPEDLNDYFHNKWMQNPSSVKPEDITNACDAIYPYTTGLWAEETAKYAHQFGCDYILYEAGQHCQPHNQKEWPYNNAVWDAQISPKMYDLYMKNFAKHVAQEVDCKLYMAFSYIGERKSKYGSWGHLEKTEDVYAQDMMATAPKYKALLDANAPKSIIPSPTPTITPVNTSTPTPTPTSTPIDIRGCDLNGDNVINMEDIMVVAGSFGSIRGETRFNGRCDLNKDDSVNMADIMIVAVYFNRIIS